MYFVRFNGSTILWYDCDTVQMWVALSLMANEMVLVVAHLVKVHSNKASRFVRYQRRQVNGIGEE